MSAPSIFVAAAVLTFSGAICARALVNGEEEEQREAIYARDGETAEDARARLELCVSSEFGLCPTYEVSP